MADGVRITVHYQKRRFPPRDHQVRGVIVRSRRGREKFYVARFLLKVFHLPWRPQRLAFFLRKLLHRDLAIARETKMPPGKVEHFGTSASAKRNWNDGD